jgi:hypothetical protein
VFAGAALATTVGGGAALSVSFWPSKMKFGLRIRLIFSSSASVSPTFFAISLSASPRRTT